MAAGGAGQGAVRGPDRRRAAGLDEPTAHLDVRSGFDVFGRLAANKGDATVVLISHRLSAVRQADRIVLLDGGRITESGSPAELTALGGSPAELYGIQSTRFAPAPRFPGVALARRGHHSAGRTSR